MSSTLEQVDFGLQDMPGRELHDVLRVYRERGPVQPTRFLGAPAFVITGYEALLDAFRDVERFPPHRMYEVSFEPAIGRSFISMQDAEQHRVYRRLATPAFRSRQVERYEREGLPALAREVALAFEARDELDLVGEFTQRFPYLVITRLLGLPRAREEAFHHWALALLRFREEPVAAARAAAELNAVLGPALAARRAAPRDDVISALIAASLEGRRLNDEEVASHVRLLFPTGGETTHGSLGNLIYALLTHEGAWARLRDRPQDIPAAVEEALRWETPIAALPRLSRSESIEFHGVEIPANSWVLFAVAGANRDPSRFEDPDLFDISRDCSDTLTFGRGVKSCPGMHLARKNMAVGLQALLECLPALELLDVEAAQPRRTVLRGPAALRVRRRR